MFSLNAHVIRLSEEDTVQLIVVAANDGGVQLVFRGDGGDLVAWTQLTIEQADELGQALAHLAAGVVQ